MSFDINNLKKYYPWALGFIVLLLLLWWGISSFIIGQDANVGPVARLRYCGAELEELCILSFGRDVDENLVINLYVPDRDFPDFKLNIKRRAGESEYTCEKFAEVPTSVFCYGEMISLQERMEISLISVEDENMLAFGNVILEAILVSGQFPISGFGAATSAAGASENSPTVDVTTAPSSARGTEFPTTETTDEPATSTPETSYPNQSYP